MQVSPRVLFLVHYFLVYINDLVDNISSDAKLFTDDTSIFTVVYNEEASATVLNNDLDLIKQWAFQWKMQFNPDVNKQAVEVIFSCKRIKRVHPLIFFNDIIVKQLPKHKHLGLTLDSELTFDKHIQEFITKARKGIEVIRFMSKYFQRNVLDELYKLYVRPHLDYCDVHVIYHKHDPTFKLEFTKRLESVQYSAALAVSGAWNGTNMDRLYEELGWEPLYYRMWQRQLTHFYKLVNSQTPQHLAQYIPEQRHNPYNLRHCNTYPIVSARTERFSHTYFPYCVREWNQLDSNIRTQPMVSSFKRKRIAIIRPEKRSTFKVSDLKLLTRLRVKFSDLCEHKLRRNFYITLMCLCGEDTETTEHYLIHCQLYADRREILFDTVSSIIQNDVSTFHENDLCSFLLYGDPSFNEI